LLILALLTTVLGVACDESATSAPQARGADAGALSLERAADPFDFADPGFFTPIPASAQCTAGGGLDQLTLPTGFVASLVVSEPAYPDVPDMNTSTSAGPTPGGSCTAPTRPAATAPYR
jgi:hypothetical protein